MTTFTTEDRLSMQTSMNAHELAVRLLEVDSYVYPFVFDASDMLIKQAGQIVDLKNHIRYLESQVYGGTTK